VAPSTESLLDVCCGFNSPVQYLSAGRRGFRHRRLPAPCSRKVARRDSRRLMSRCRCSTSSSASAPSHSTAVVASDIIEHFTEADALEPDRSDGARGDGARSSCTRRMAFLPQGQEYGKPFNPPLRMDRLADGVDGVSRRGSRDSSGCAARWAHSLRPWRFGSACRSSAQALVRNRPRWPSHSVREGQAAGLALRGTDDRNEHASERTSRPTFVGRAWSIVSVYLFVPIYLKFLSVEAYAAGWCVLDVARHSGVGRCRADGKA